MSAEMKLTGAMREVLNDLAGVKNCARYRVTVRTYDALEARGLIRYWYATFYRIEAALTDKGRELVASWGKPAPAAVSVDAGEPANPGTHAGTEKRDA